MYVKLSPHSVKFYTQMNATPWYIYHYVSHIALEKLQTRSGNVYYHKSGDTHHGIVSYTYYFQLKSLKKRKISFVLRRNLRLCLLN